MAGKKKLVKLRAGNKQPIPNTQKIKKSVKQKIVLNYGCGMPEDGTLHKNFMTPEWKVVRLDNFDRAEADIKSHLYNRQQLDSQSVDAICMTHTLERLEYHEVATVLNEAFRLLRKGGIIQLVANDLQTIGEELAKGSLESAVSIEEVRFSPINLLYGNTERIRIGEKFRIRKTAFLANTIGNKLSSAGFRDIRIVRKQHLLIVTAKRNQEGEGDKNVKVINHNNITKMMFERDNLMQKPVLPVNYKKP